MQHSCHVAVDRWDAGAAALRQYGIEGRLLPVPAEAFPMWLVDTTRSRTDMAEGLLSTPERARAARYKTEALRNRYVVAHGGLRVILRDIYGVAVDAQPLSENEYGKPFLRSVPHLHFSISYSVGYVLIGVNDGGGEIGVDIEVPRPIVDAASLAELHYTASERMGMQAGHPAEAELSRRFLGVWVRKEACVKASGRGLGIPLTEVECGGGEQVTIVRLSDGQCYRTGVIQLRGDPIVGWAHSS